MSNYEINTYFSISINDNNWNLFNYSVSELKILNVHTCITRPWNNNKIGKEGNCCKLMHVRRMIVDQNLQGRCYYGWTPTFNTSPIHTVISSTFDRKFVASI